MSSAGVAGHGLHLTGIRKTKPLKQILYDWNGANEAIFHWINGIDGSLHDELMLFGTLISSNRNFAGYIAAIVICALWRLRRTVLSRGGAVAETSLHWIGCIGVFCVAYVLDSLLVLWIKTALAYPRPPLVLPPQTVRILGDAEYTLSFPSGHASFAMVLVASLWPLLNSGWRVCGIVFVAWVAWSRISVGAHFPSDIIGSYFLAVLIVIAVRLVMNGYLAKAIKRSRCGSEIAKEESGGAGAGGDRAHPGGRTSGIDGQISPCRRGHVR
jgi:membrane-associated phospholipid phosphatase